MDHILLIAFVIFSAHVGLLLSEEFTCPRSRGYYPHPTECKKYYSCRKRISTLKSCPEQMLFDVEKGNCYYYSAVDCGNRKKPSVTVVTMQEIKEESRTTADVNWNTNIQTSSVVSKVSTYEIPSSMSSSKDTRTISSNILNTSNPIDISYDTTKIPDIESGTSETILHVVSDTSDTIGTKTSNFDYTSETALPSMRTDDAIGTSKFDFIVSTESELITDGKEKPWYTTSKLDDNTLVTDILKPSSSKPEASESDHDANDKTGNISGASTSDLNSSSTAGLTELESTTERIVEWSGSTSDVPWYTNKSDNDTLATNTFSLSTNKPETSEREYDTTERTIIISEASKSDINSYSTMVLDESESTMKRIDGWSSSTSSDLEKTSTIESDLTTSKKSDISNLDYGSTVSDWPYIIINTTDDDNETNVSELDRTSTVSSDAESIGISYTTLEFFGSNSTSPGVSDGHERTTSDGKISTTKSSKDITNSISVGKVTGIATSEHVQSTKVATTRQSIIVTDEYDDYMDSFDCPTAYGRYPHPTDKHKFLHCQEWFPHIMVCPANLIFDPKLEICVWSRRS